MLMKLSCSVNIFWNVNSVMNKTTNILKTIIYQVVPFFFGDRLFFSGGFFFSRARGSHRYDGDAGG